MAMILTLLLSFHAHAEWFCTSQSSQTFSDHVEACGVGEGKTEAQARLDAFDQASLEASRISPGSIASRPMRTECVKTETGIRCYRMVSFSSGKNSSGKQTVTGKVHLGMDKTNVLSLLGTPSSVQHGSNYLQVFYAGPQCAGSLCYVVFENDKLTKTVNLKASLEEI